MTDVVVQGHTCPIMNIVLKIMSSKNAKKCKPTWMNRFQYDNMYHAFRKYISW